MSIIRIWRRLKGVFVLRSLRLLICVNRDRGGNSLQCESILAVTSFELLRLLHNLRDADWFRPASRGTRASAKVNVNCQAASSHHLLTAASKGLRSIAGIVCVVDIDTALCSSLGLRLGSGSFKFDDPAALHDRRNETSDWDA